MARYADTGAATGRAIGIGLNVNRIRNAPSPMIHEPSARSPFRPAFVALVPSASP
jgi:hypothetical protein